MDIKIFALIAVGLIVVAGLLFVDQTDKKDTPTLPKPTVISEVQKIRAVQTNPDTGEVEYTLTANAMTQNTDGTNVLSDVVMDWTPPRPHPDSDPNANPDGKGTEHYTIRASTASLDDKTGDFVFDKGFEFVHHSTPTTITGGTLTGNTKTRLLKSQSPLTITQGDSEFTAQGFGADLNTAVYEFYQIAMTFNTPERTDKPLF